MAGILLKNMSKSFIKKSKEGVITVQLSDLDITQALVSMMRYATDYGWSNIWDTSKVLENKVKCAGEMLLETLETIIKK